MRKPVLTIFYQFNPWKSTIGGIQTLINLFIKYAPNEFEVRLVGTESDRTQPVGKWQEAEFAGRKILFFPLFTIENDNVRHLIPTTVRYTNALMGKCFASDFMHFHRLEPTLVTRNWQGEKTLFIHNDIQHQILSKGDKRTILWRRFPRAYFALERFLIGNFNEIMACNAIARESYRQLYPKLADRITYLSNIFDQNVFYPLSVEERSQGRKQLAQRLGIVDNTRFVLFAGRLHPQKDPILLLRSIAALKVPDTHFLIAGDGDLLNEVSSEIVKLGLSKQVTMLGALKQEELADMLRICNLFVLTSAFEGIPLVVLEALACGTPVVTTRCGETPKLVTNGCGIVCEERTPTSIANALQRVLMRPEDYTSQSCLQVAQPYAASTVISNVYNQMFERWKLNTTSVASHSMALR